jgi:hypothetical protein
MIFSPDPAASRSCLADWLELRALFIKNGAGEADIASLLRLSSDDHRDRESDETGIIVEDEILEGDLEATLERIFTEISSRARTLGNEYPFNFERHTSHLTVKEDLTTPHWVYLFLLLLSGEGDKLLPNSEKLNGLIRDGRTLFHACASIGVAGLLRNANTIWFGWPRNDHSSFLPALANLCEKLGCGKAKAQIPAGLPKAAKDDYIDVVGWRAFRDKRNGNLLVLCQAATGRNWDDKSVTNHIDAFKDWFEIVPYGQATGSIAIPFPAHHDVCEHPAEGFEVACHNSLNRAHKRLGVLIDRMRIVESVWDVDNDTRTAAAIGGLDRLPDLKAWVGNTVEAIKEAA